MGACILRSATQIALQTPMGGPSTASIRSASSTSSRASSALMPYCRSSASPVPPLPMMLPARLLANSSFRLALGAPAACKSGSPLPIGGPSPIRAQIMLSEPSSPAIGALMITSRRPSTGSRATSILAPVSWRMALRVAPCFPTTTPALFASMSNLAVGCASPECGVGWSSGGSCCGRKGSTWGKPCIACWLAMGCCAWWKAGPLGQPSCGAYCPSGIRKFCGFCNK
mmetsp:Transcript_10453/g.27786  ORF Transcript_10453/g.27786 Transcript_10453/m.27786 type:complete len:227 (+) Transcript_10453:249-929(+)